MKGFTLTEEEALSAKAKAELWCARLDALLSMDLPFYKIGIPHLAYTLLWSRDRAQYLALLDLIPEEEMVRLFTKAAACGVGIELNSDDMTFTDEEADTVLRIFRIAKQCGCKFYCGSDAHHPALLDAVKPIFERAIDLLGLEETDKFHIGTK